MRNKSVLERILTLNCANVCDLRMQLNQFIFFLQNKKRDENKMLFRNSGSQIKVKWKPSLVVQMGKNISFQWHRWPISLESEDQRQWKTLQHPGLNPITERSVEYDRALGIIPNTLQARLEKNWYIKESWTTTDRCSVIARKQYKGRCGRPDKNRCSYIPHVYEKKNAEILIILEMVNSQNERNLPPIVL